MFNNEWRRSNYSAEQKEIINSTIEFFFFIKNKNNFVILDDIHRVLNSHSKISLFFENEKIFYLTLFIFKAFLHFSPVHLSFFGKYKNSDKLLDFCVNSYVSYCIFYDIDYESRRKIRGEFLTMFIVLLKNKIIEEKKIKINKFLVKFWSISVKEKIECDFKDFKISYLPFSIKKNKKNGETYLVGYFFWNVYDMYSKNFYSDTRFNVTKEEYLDLLLKRHLYIDVSYFEWIKKIWKDEEEESLEELHDRLLKKFDKENWNIDVRSEIEELQKRYSKKIENIVLNNFLNTRFCETDKIYIPFYFDFRGRKYYNSLVGPTQNKLLRFVYYYGWYEYAEFSNLIKINRVLFFENKIKSFCEKNNYEYRLCFLESYFWILISIGKFKIDKTKIETNDEVILDYGIELVENGKRGKVFNSCDVAEKVEMLHYFEILKSIKMDYNKPIKKKILSKDGTASVYQVSMLLLKPKNNDALRYVNLYSKDNVWIDTYSYIIAEFKKKENLEESFYEILTRKTCKKVIMTIPYSIGVENAYVYFKESLKKDNVSIEVKDLKKKFTKFYNFVKNDFEKDFFYNTSTKEYTDRIMESYLDLRAILIKSETGQTDLSYKKMEKKTIDLILEIKVNEEFIKERITKLIKVPSESIDVQQTNISLGANLRHFYEADLLRATEVTLGYSINSIHDAELIDFNSCSRLILIKNRIFQSLLIDYEIWSIFILI